MQYNTWLEMVVVLGFWILAVLGIELRDMNILDKCFTT
jgi:hypothetical protein